MSMNIILARSNDEASRVLSSCSMPEDVHRDIFSDITGQVLPSSFSYSGYQIGKFPMLSRMNDYYRDAKYSGDEINALLKELHQVVSVTSLSDTSLRCLQVFIKAVQKAYNSKMNVYCHAD